MSLAISPPHQYTTYIILSQESQTISHIIIIIIIYIIYIIYNHAQAQRNGKEERYQGNID